TRMSTSARKRDGAFERGACTACRRGRIHRCSTSRRPFRLPSSDQTWGGPMRGPIQRSLFAGACIVVVPLAALAQGSITGVVRDASGAVLPGVTVEAASPVLIEKVRAVVTDGTGQYRIVDLRPGVYTVTFTLTSFTTVKREGIELTGSFTATVN